MSKFRNKEEIEENKWEDAENAQEVIDFIKKSTSKGSKWVWRRNSQCKYVSLRFDTRGGDFIILDRDDNRITFEELKKQ